jgi:hypothetical protein
MTIEALVDTGKIALAADWMELMAMLSSRQTSSPADLVRSLSVLEEPEHELVDLIVINSEEVKEEVEEEILQSRSELWVSDVREELGTRRASLGGAYPFKIVGSGSAWRLTYEDQPDRHDHLFYSCCLLITARRHHLVSYEVPEMDKILQIIAYLVAGRIVAGTAYWFGYPRPDDTGKMEDAVKELLRRIGFDSLELVPPVWSVGAENDGGIDVVAWRNFGDGLPSRVVVYGQVASGRNWKSKPVNHYAESTFRDWLKDYGQRYYVPAMFIAWQQYLEVTPTRDRSFRRRVLDLAMENEKSLGLTVDRGRIAELATETTRTGNGDESEWIAYLLEWRSSVLASLTE